MTSEEHKQKHEVSCVEGKPYLADVQVGDKLYNFLEKNKRYTVRSINHGGSDNDLYPIQVVGEDKFTINISRHGTKYFSEKVPYFLYAPVDVLDSKNLPPRAWKPEKDEWIWGRVKGGTWILARFYQSDENGFWCHHQDKGKCFFDEIAPFKGELPPGLEEEK